MRRLFIGLVSLIVFLSLIPALAASPPKFGTTCPKSGLIQNYNGLKFTCIKSGKKLIWDKGVAVKKPSGIPSPTPTPSPSSAPSATPTQTQTSTTIQKELDSCLKLGERIQNTNGLFECRRIVGNRLVWINIHSDLPLEIKNVNSPDPISTCQIGDKRSSKIFNWPGIAFPATPAPGFSTKGHFKIIVVGIDFPDVRGEGKPSDIWQSDITKAKEWIDWYSSGQVNYDFV